METFSGETSLPELFCFPSIKRFTLKGKNLLALQWVQQNMHEVYLVSSDAVLVKELQRATYHRQMIVLPDVLLLTKLDHFRQEL